MATPTGPNFGNFSSIVPGAKAVSATAAGPAGKFSDLIPKAAPVATSTPAAAASVPTPAPTPSYGAFSSLIPKNEPVMPIAAPKANLDFVSQGIKDFGNLITPPRTAVNTGLQVNDFNQQDERAAIGKKGAVERTLAYLPSEIMRHLPFGIGGIFGATQDEPDTFKDLSAMDFVKAIPTVAKEVIKAPIAAGANFYPKPVSFDIPGLGKVTNRQFNAAQRIANGEDPTAVTLEEGSGAIFDTLLLYGVAAKVFAPRESVITKVNATQDAGITAKQGPKSFRLYEGPKAVTPLSEEMVTKMAQEKGVDLGPKYDPKLPTFFRLRTGGTGDVIGEVVQVKPSYAKTFVDSFKSDFSKVPESEVNPPLISGKVSETALENAKPIAAPKTAEVPAVVPRVASPAAIEPVPAAQPPIVPAAAPTVTPPVAETPITQPSEPTPSRFGNFSDITPHADAFPVGTKGYATYTVDVGGEKIKVNFTPGLHRGSVMHVEFRGPKGNPISETGYKSHFLQGAPADYGITPSNIQSKLQELADTLANGGEIPTKPTAQAPAVSASSAGEASIGNYRTGEPVTLGARESVKPIELPEMVSLASELMGSAPKIRLQASRAFGGQARGVFKGKGPGEITLRADLFDPKVNSIDQVAKTLAHEIGHLMDYLPTGTLARGNLMGRLNTLTEYYNELAPKFGTSRSDSAVSKELWEFSKYWRPLDEATATPGFLKYRKSGKELYADFISGLMNDPAKVQEMAPEAYNTFFEALDKKPAVKDAYFDLQALLHGERSNIIKVRREGVQRMFKEGDMKSLDYEKRLQLERADRRKASLNELKFLLVDNNTPMIERVKKLEKQGTHINMDEDPRYMLEERNYIGGQVKAEIERNVVPIYDSLKKAEIPWGTFGEALFYERILSGDRSTQANPRGITPDAAQESYDALKAELGPEKMEVLDKAMDDFRGWLKNKAEDAYKEGLYSPELYAEMKKNPAYVTFRVLEHIEDGISSKVYRSIGTLKDITNPADASILKTVATIRAIERNKVMRTSVDFLKEHYSDEIEKARTVFNGKGQQFVEPKEQGRELVTMKRNGKAEGYYVDEYVAHSLNNDTIGENKAMMMLVSPARWANQHLWKPLFIGYNPGFHAFNLIRDFKRFWKNTPNMSMATAFKRYIQAMPVARVRAFGMKENPGELAQKAYKLMTDAEAAKIFSSTFTDYAVGEEPDQTHIEQILRNTGLDSFNPEAKRRAWEKVIRPITKVLDTMRRVGNYIETLPKTAAIYELTKGSGDVNALTAEERSFVRKNVGSPDFLTRGYASPVTNELFLFSNAITQGLRSDIQTATGPKTRSGYWWKTAKLTLLPKILMYMAGLGLFGKSVKDMMDSASEYDKANYTIVPLGRDSKTGKAIYLRIPDDETGRMIGAAFWKTLNLTNKDRPQTFGQDLTDIASFMGGQVPGLAPTLTVPKDIGMYLSGKNPYDSFRGQPAIPDQVFQAHNLDTHKAFLSYIINQMGGGIFYRFSANSQAPREKGPMEEIVNIPLVSNILGRFVRVSDYGITEQLNAVKENAKTEQAREYLENGKLVNKYVEKAIDTDPDSTERRKLEVEMVHEKFGGEPKNAEEAVKARNLVAKFRESFVKGISGPEIDALASAQTNAEKIELLKNIQSRVSEEDFANIKTEALKNKLVSPETFYKFEHE